MPEIAVVTGASEHPAGKSVVRGRYILLKAIDDTNVETLDNGAVLQVGGRIAEIGKFADIVIEEALTNSLRGVLIASELDEDWIK